MTTFVLLWNPGKWPWAEYDRGVVTATVEAEGGYDEPWTTGSRTQGIVPGDRIFLLKTGRPPRGIVAAGFARSPIYRAPHWDPTQPGDAPHVDMTWTHVVRPADVLSNEALDESVFPHRVMGGGLLLPDDRAVTLETAWAEHLTGLAGDAAGVRVRGRLVTRARVLRVMQEYRDLGHGLFLAKYGYRSSHQYWVEYQGSRYDARVVLGVVAGLDPDDLLGDGDIAAHWERLGFTRGRIDPEADVPVGVEPRPHFRPRDMSAVPSTPTYSVDPDTAGRGARAHRALENWLAEQVIAAGHQPLDPAPADPPFDLGWLSPAGTMTVVEVKSLTSSNETTQIRLGLGQVLEYAHRLGPHPPVRAVLLLERAPSAIHWADVCTAAGVELWWPGRNADL